MNPTIWTRETLADEYPGLVAYARSSGGEGRLSAADVPREFWPFIPYAELWGVPDDGDRAQLIAQAPSAVLENLVAVIGPLDPLLDPWLAGPEAHAPKTQAYLAFSFLRRAADSASLRLARRR